MAARIAFETPDNSRTTSPSSDRPIDLVHLARQTMGDKALETEILQMFARQSRGLLQEISTAERDTAVALAHRLKGSAKAIGAFKVSVAAERLEAEPEDAGAMASLQASMIEAENFITGLCR
ncbi:Hpt domain-containing protein [Neorhizobium sp. NCHU2750]|uniref:Hpt domain-containing protein n=1 Tax=Neorhizobium sp. NCHU2750 TaxID=1825976 RepID=UPI000E74A180|nr:transcriptional regulator [Neorhizobium sp. NCHU2750]